MTSNLHIPIGIYVLLGLPIFFTVLIAVVARLEKRMSWPYGELQPQPGHLDKIGYALKWTEQAQQAGCLFLGWAPDIKGPSYRISYAMLVTPERDGFVIIGGGVIGGLRYHGTMIFSRTADGGIFFSTDQQNCAEIDVSRQWHNQLVKASGFASLLSKHQTLLNQRGTLIYRFTEGREAEEFKLAREIRFRNMANQGLIAPVDDTRWCYTTKGAIKMACLGYWIGLLRALTGGQAFKVA